MSSLDPVVVYMTIMLPIFPSRNIAARPVPSQRSEEEMIISYIWQSKAHLLDALDG